MAEITYLNDRKQFNSNGGGGTNPPMDIIDAKIGASEARTDTKFAEMMGELRLMNARLDHIEGSTKGLRGSVWTACLASLGVAVGALFGLYQYGASVFGVGMTVETIVNSAANASSSKIQPQLDALSRNNDEIAKTTNANAELLRRMLAQFAISNESTQPKK